MNSDQESEKEKALSNLLELSSKISTTRSRLSSKDLTRVNYYDYDELVSMLELYVLLYSVRNQELRERLRGLPLRPAQYANMVQAYENLGSICNLCRAEVRSNYDFNINPDAANLEVVTSKPYISFLKEGALKADGVKGELISLQEKLDQTIAEKSKTEDEVTNLESTAHNSRNKIISLEEEIANLVKAESDFGSKIDLLTNENATLLNELRFFKEQVQRTEVARNSSDFQDQADSNKRIAKLWGIAALVTMVAFIAIIYFILSKSGELFDIAREVTEKSKSVDTALTHQIIIIEIAKRLGARLLMVSIIVYLITFLVKNYNAQMHNYIINSHKANALRSTVDLIGTAKQDDGNDKIIIQATQAIFTTQKSGYQGAESEPASPSLITNVVDAVTKKN